MICKSSHTRSDTLADSSFRISNYVSVQCPTCNTRVMLYPSLRDDLAGYEMLIEEHEDNRLSANPWIAVLDRLDE